MEIIDDKNTRFCAFIWRKSQSVVQYLLYTK